MRGDGTPGSVEEMLAAARAKLRRVSPAEAHAAMREGALLVDVRSERQREADGIIPGSHFVSRNVLEWRLDPACPHRDPLLAAPDRGLILICHEGYQSSLAAATLQAFGTRQVSDVSGGFRAWRAEGLPVQHRGEPGGSVRAFDCACGHRLEASDDDELFRGLRAHVACAHPEAKRTDQQLRDRIGDDAYDVTGTDRARA